MILEITGVVTIKFLFSSGKKREDSFYNCQAAASSRSSSTKSDPDVSSYDNELCAFEARRNFYFDKQTEGLLFRISFLNGINRKFFHEIQSGRLIICRIGSLLAGLVGSLSLENYSAYIPRIQ